MKNLENLGKRAKDKITGFEGIITSLHIYITGCNQYHIQPDKLSEKGEVAKGEYFDSGRVEILGLGVSQQFVTDEHDGGPEREHPNRS